MTALAFFLQNQPDPEVVQRIILLMIPIFLVIMVVVIAIIMVPCWFILKKAGLSPWLSTITVYSIRPTPAPGSTRTLQTNSFVAADAKSP